MIKHNIINIPPDAIVIFDFNKDMSIDELNGYAKIFKTLLPNNQLVFSTNTIKSITTIRGGK